MIVVCRNAKKRFDSRFYRLCIIKFLHNLIMHDNHCNGLVKFSLKICNQIRDLVSKQKLLLLFRLTKTIISKEVVCGSAPTEKAFKIYLNNSTK